MFIPLAGELLRRLIHAQHAPGGIEHQHRRIRRVEHQPPFGADALQGEMQLRLLFVGALTVGDVYHQAAGNAAFYKGQGAVLHPAQTAVCVDKAILDVEFFTALQPLPGGAVSGAVVRVNDLIPETCGPTERGGVLKGLRRMACEWFDTRRTAQPAELAVGRLRLP